MSLIGILPIFATSLYFLAYSLDNALHLGHPVSIVDKCRVFQKNLLESLSSYSNLREIAKCRSQNIQITYLEPSGVISFYL